MRIDIWLDITCPYSYLGIKNLELALQQLPVDNKVDIGLHSFEIRPENTIKSHIVQRPSTLRVNMTSMENVGLPSKMANENENTDRFQFGMDRILTTNSFHAHRLIKLAELDGKAMEVLNLLFEAHFNYGLNIGLKEVLIDIARKLGMDVRINLEGKVFEMEVRNDETMAVTLDIRKVPFFMIDSKYSVIGAQPIWKFVEIFTNLCQLPKEQFGINLFSAKGVIINC